LINIENLTLYSKKGRAILKNLNLRIGDESLAIIGPSGSGKSSLLLSILNIFDNKRVKGSVFTDKKISCIFQDTSSYLDPTMKIGSQIAECASNQVANELMKRLRIEDICDKYPHQLSAGQKQRVMIAIAVAIKPDVILADEALNNLDKDNADIAKELLGDFQTIFVTHDIDSILNLVSRVITLNEGGIVQDVEVSKFTKKS